MGVCCGKDKGDKKPFRPGEDVMRRQDEEEEKEAQDVQKDPLNPDPAPTHLPLGMINDQASPDRDPNGPPVGSLQNLSPQNKKNQEPVGNSKVNNLPSASSLKDPRKAEANDPLIFNRLNTGDNKPNEGLDQGKDSSNDESYVKRVSRKQTDQKNAPQQQAQVTKDPNLPANHPEHKFRLKQGEQELMIDVPDGALIKAEELHQANFNSQNSKSRNPSNGPNNPWKDQPPKPPVSLQPEELRAKQTDKSTPRVGEGDANRHKVGETGAAGARRISIDQHVVMISPHLAVDPQHVRISSDHLSGVSPPGSGVLAPPGHQSSLGAADPNSPKKNSSIDKLPGMPSQLSVAGRTTDSPPKQMNLGMRGLKSVFTINEITEPDPTIIAGDGLGKPSAVNVPAPADEVIGSESVHIKLSVNQGDRTDQNLKMIPDQQLNVVSFKPNFFNMRQLVTESGWSAADKQKKEEAKEFAEHKKYEEIHEMVRAETFTHNEQHMVIDDGWILVHGEGEVMKEN